jgi:hypothetical protein
MFTLPHAIFMQGLGQRVTQPVATVIYGWGQYKDQVPLLPKPERDKVDQLADLIVSSFEQTALPPFRRVEILGHADKDWHGPSWEDTVSFNRAMAVQEALEDSIGALMDERNMGPTLPGGGVDWTADGAGATKMIAPPYSAKNRRVAVTLIRAGPPVPVVTNTKVIEVTAKSFIALIGSRVGSIPGIKIVVPPPPAPQIPVPVPRQTLLEALAKGTDFQFNENPRNTAKDKGYRLFSSCQFTVVFENKKILAAVPSTLDTDVGNEGPLEPPPLITTPVKVSPTGGSSVTFSWFATGRPHRAAEPAFQEVQSRTSVFIWHAIEGEIDVSSGTAVTTVSIRGSQFPSHRVFVDSALVLPELVQGPFSNLWVADPTDSTRVR